MFVCLIWTVFTFFIITFHGFCYVFFYETFTLPKTIIEYTHTHTHTHMLEGSTHGKSTSITNIVHNEPICDNIISFFSSSKAGSSPFQWFWSFWVDLQDYPVFRISWHPGTWAPHNFFLLHGGFGLSIVPMDVQERLAVVMAWVPLCSRGSLRPFVVRWPYWRLVLTSTTGARQWLSICLSLSPSPTELLAFLHNFS